MDEASGNLLPIDHPLQSTATAMVGQETTETQPRFGQDDEYVLTKINDMINVSKDISGSQKELEFRMRSIQEKNTHLETVIKEAERERLKRKRDRDEKHYDPVQGRRLKKDLREKLGTIKLDLAIKKFSLPADITKKNFKVRTSYISIGLY